MPTLISTTTSPEIPARSASIGYLGAGVLIGRRLGAIGGLLPIWVRVQFPVLLQVQLLL